VSGMSDHSNAPAGAVTRREALLQTGAILSLDAQGPSSFWPKIVAQYETDRGTLNLENSYWGAMARPVVLAYLERVKTINRLNTIYVRNADSDRSYAEDLENTRKAVARFLGCDVSEIVLTRGGSEALANLIIQYNRLSSGDAIAYCDLDYDAMQRAMDYIARLRGLERVRIAIPEPASYDAIIGAYETLFRSHQRLKLLLLTHLSNRTGLLLPVADIAKMARARGVDVILDAAQSIGQVAFKVEDLNADFAGFSLHKWVGAPLGTGAIYIRFPRLADIDPHFENRDFAPTDIRGRVGMGTSDFAATLTIPDAIQFNQSIGSAQKEQRLRYLYDYWVEKIADVKSIQVLTPKDSSLHAGISAIRVTGLEAAVVQKRLLNEHRILTVARKGIAKGDAVRISPALYTTEPDLDRFVAALRQIAGRV
jgi:isopenicillin-N epimerase